MFDLLEREVAAAVGPAPSLPVDDAVDVDGTAIIAALAVIDRMTAQVVEALDGFDRTQGWRADGATSLTGWLRANARMGPMASVLVARMRALRQLPVTAEAWRSGVLSSDQTRMVVDHVPEHHRERFAAGEGSLVPLLGPLPVRDVEQVIREWSARADAIDDRPPPEAAGLRHHPMPDGTWRLDGTVSGAAGEVIESALRLASSAPCPGESARTPAQRRADALETVCRFFLSHHDAPIAARHRPHLNVIVDVGDLAAGHVIGTIDGRAVAARHLERLCCDANVTRLVMAGRSTVVESGSATRVVPSSLFRAVAARDRRCRFPGCDRPISWCDAHHVRFWRHGGPTEARNLVLLCSRHHGVVHQPGWRLELHDDASVTVTNPNGAVQVSRPPP